MENQEKEIEFPLAEKEITWQDNCNANILKILLDSAPIKIQDDPVLDYQSYASAYMLAVRITKYIGVNIMQKAIAVIKNPNL